MGELCGSLTDYLVITVGELCVFLLAGAYDVSDVILSDAIGLVVRHMVGIGVKTLEGSGKKLKQSS